MKRRLGGPQSRSERFGVENNFLPLPGFEPRIQSKEYSIKLYYSVLYRTLSGYGLSIDVESTPTGEAEDTLNSCHFAPRIRTSENIEVQVNTTVLLLTATLVFIKHGPVSARIQFHSTAIDTHSN
jgi:hypothetical protein